MDFKSRSIGNSARWSDKTVRRTLQDRMYIGDMVQGKSRKINYKTKGVRSCTPDEWIYARTYMGEKVTVTINRKNLTYNIE